MGRGCHAGKPPARIQREESPWDVSSRAVQTREPFDLAQYQTVEPFLENETIGNSVATYCSGHGFAAGMDSSQFHHQASDLLYRYVVDKCPEARDLDEPGRVDEDVSELLADELLECEFMQHI